MLPNDQYNIKRGLVGIWDVLVTLFSIGREVHHDIHNLATHKAADTPTGELGDLYARLSRYAGTTSARQKDLCQQVAKRAYDQSFEDRVPPTLQISAQLLKSLVASEGVFTVPTIDPAKKRSIAETWELSASLKQSLTYFEQPDKVRRLEDTLERFLHCVPLDHLPAGEADAAASVPLYVLLPNPAMAVECVVGSVLGEPRESTPLPKLWDQLERNHLIASGIDPAHPEESRKEPITPTKAKGMDTEQLISTYLGNTPFADFFYDQSSFCNSLHRPL